MGLSWKKPPPVVVIGGNEDFLRKREVNWAMRVAQEAGLSLETPETQGEVVSSLEFASTFGSPTLVVTGPKAVDTALIEAHQERKPDRVCLLVVVPGPMSEKKLPFLEKVPGGFMVEHSRPTQRKKLQARAVRFAQIEANRLLKSKSALDAKLAEALVSAVGTDLGVLAFEVSKVTALARARNETVVSSTMLRSTIRPNLGVELGPLRDALRARSPQALSRALRRVQRGAGSGDPIMLLLRARGGPADLALSWYQASLVRDEGADIDEICGRLGLQRWVAEKDVLPALRRWDTASLRQLIADLARVERGVFEGAPSTWAACEAALFRACIGSQ